jgi:hypothetical protein
LNVIKMKFILMEIKEDIAMLQSKGD